MSATTAPGLGAAAVAARHAPAAPAALSGTVPFGLPALLYGVRMWVAVCLALYVAFALELDNPSWAGTTAAIVCQPAVGASLRKGWFRMIGTVVGAIFIVVLTACFPQSRVGFMLGLAVWGGSCALAATLLRNFASYAAALAGYTAAIIAADTLGAVGGANGEVFILAITRATEILLGIACASVVLGLSDFGSARQRLGALLAGFAAEIGDGLVGAFGPEGMAEAGRPHRRDLLLRASGLGVIMDQAAGEISSLPFRPRVLRAAVEGLYGALSAWRVVATHVERRPALAREAAARVMQTLPPELQPGAAPEAWLADPLALRRACLLAARRLVALRARTGSGRLLADSMAEGLLGLGRTLVAVAELRLGRPLARPTGTVRPSVPDWLSPLIAALRAFLTIAVAELVWVWTAWPNGGTMVLFAAVTITLFAPREDAAYSLVLGFLVGTMITTVLAAVIGFAVLPGQASFAQFCLCIGLVLVPAGALSGQAWQQPLFVAMVTNFIPLLAPGNPMAYDPGAFYNLAVSLLAGVGLAALALRLLPPVPPELRARRLLTLCLRDLRRLAGAAGNTTVPDWESRLYGRLAAMPRQAHRLQPTRLVAGLFVGSEIIRLRRVTARLGLTPALQPALDAVRRGDSAAAIAALERLGALLDAMPDEPGLGRARLRARGGGMAIAEALATHPDFFDAAAPP